MSGSSRQVITAGMTHACQTSVMAMDSDACRPLTCRLVAACQALDVTQGEGNVDKGLESILCLLSQFVLARIWRHI